MADYYEDSYSTYNPPSSHQGDTPTDGAAMHRSFTHNGYASVSTSTRSWVFSNQMNPPPPPVERPPSSGLIHFHGPRPLPKPQPVRRIPVRYPTPPAEDEEGEGGTQLGPSPLGMQYGQQTKVLAKGEGDRFPPTSMGNSQDKLARGGRSLVGGLMNGLRRLPAVLGIEGGGQKSKRQLVRQGTFRSDDTSPSAIGINTENSLPRYLLNPSIGPSDPQFAHRLSVAVANGSLPPSPDASASQSRPGPHGPLHPKSPTSVSPQPPNSSRPNLLDHAFGHAEPRPKFPCLIRITPPSVSESVTGEEEMTDIYNEPPADDPQYPQFESQAPNTNDTRVTAMVYNSDGSHSTITPPAQPIHAPPVSCGWGPQPQPCTNDQIRDEPPSAPTMAFASPPMSPRGDSSGEEPSDLLSPQPASRYTMMTVTSHSYEPSFASHLTPIKRFFRGLYNLPWVARERVTIDYRPYDSNRANIKAKGGVKRPTAPWYRAVVSRSRRGSRDLDLLSNRTGSVSASTNLGNSSTPLASSTSRRSRRSSNHLSSRQNHRHRKTRHRTATSTDPPQRSLSPLIPTVYPYPYPSYPYTYPYGEYPPFSIPPPVNHTAPGHRRRHPAPKYPYGYVPYQPMLPPPPPPMYFMVPSPPPQNNIGMQMTNRQAVPQVPMQVSPSIIPGAVTQDSLLASPPDTPRVAPHSSYYMTLRGTYTSRIS